MDKHYLEQYEDLENNHWWFVVRRKIILQTMRRFIARQQAPGTSILNAGAASGVSSKWMSALGSVVSLENEPLFVARLREQQMDTIEASVDDIPLSDNIFEVVCAFDVIEHVKDDRKAVEELIRVCKPGGLVLLAVPAFNSIRGNHDIVNGHYRRYTLSRLKALLAQQPVTNLYSSYFNTILFIPIFLYRKIQSIFHHPARTMKPDFDVQKTNRVTNLFFKFLFGMEFFLLKHFRMPYGVSLIVVMRKNAAVN